MELFTPTFYWIFLGLFFVAIELFIPSFFFFLSFSISSFIVSICSYIGCSDSKSLITFIFSTPLSFTALKAIIQKYNRHITYKSSLKENLTHKYFVIKNNETYDFPKIMYQGLLWSIKEKNNKPLYHHDQVRTLRVKGNSFIVTKIH